MGSNGLHRKAQSFRSSLSMADAALVRILSVTSLVGITEVCGACEGTTLNEDPRIKNTVSHITNGKVDLVVSCHIGDRSRSCQFGGEPI